MDFLVCSAYFSNRPEYVAVLQPSGSADEANYIRQISVQSSHSFVIN